MTEEPKAHGVEFEISDAKPGLIIVSMIIIAGTVLATLLIVIVMQKALQDTTPLGPPANEHAPARVVPPSPQLLPHPWEVYPKLRQHEDEVLNGYGRDADGRIHIPIAQAISAVVGRLQIRPDSPPGLTTSGGQGRDFTGTVNALPPEYRSPSNQPQQITGKVEKGAQK